MDIDRTLLARGQGAGPGGGRPVQPAYPLYPRTEWFVEAFDAATLDAVLAARAVTGLAHLALAVTVPAEAGRRGWGDWPDWLGREAALVRARVGAVRIEALHLDIAGAVDGAGLAALLQALRAQFGLSGQQLEQSGRGISVSLPARHATPRALAALADQHATRLDLDGGAGGELASELARNTPGAASAEHQTRLARVIGGARRNGITSIGARHRFAIAGETFGAASARLSALLEARPTRIALDASVDDTLPVDGVYAEALARAVEMLADAGYEALTCGVFANADEPLARARLRGRLSQRPFGLTALPPGDTLALGPGATAATGIACWRNHRSPTRYRTALAAGRLPVSRGVLCTPEDALRRTAIQSLCTHFLLDLEDLETVHGVDAQAALQAELAECEILVAAGLMHRDGKLYELTQTGRLLASAVAAVFDAYRRRALARAPRVARL
ncbi:oxygen-independent coproporphyrinogen III oxidase [Chitinasiproducens palmae]|uniref:Coproporphyrinogen III oxidase n=1 Tax=Chitinasiproducens palmae TaxID=1770053 RepID=A0A1H2PNZ8_9BURK|nr:hypothetical protein [Chitinasiproducens palmae]SDV48449.1 Coproporphyrinogen III oxidase [Chitinasiproducens palmae]